MEHLNSISTNLCDFNYLRFSCRNDQPFTFAGHVYPHDDLRVCKWQKIDYIGYNEFVLRFDKIVKVSEYQTVQSDMRYYDEGSNLHNACSFGVLSVNVSVARVGYSDFEIRSCKGRFIVMCEDSSSSNDDKAISKFSYDSGKELAKKVYSNRKAATNKVFSTYDHDKGYVDLKEDRLTFERMIGSVSSKLDSKFNLVDSGEIYVRYHRHDVSNVNLEDNFHLSYSYDSEGYYWQNVECYNTLVGEYLSFIDDQVTDYRFGVWTSPFEFSLVEDVEDTSYYFDNDINTPISLEFQGSEQKG